LDLGKIKPKFGPNQPIAGQRQAQTKPKITQAHLGQPKNEKPKITQISISAGQSVAQVGPTILKVINF
jgi:hypothetical protein